MSQFTSFDDLPLIVHERILHCLPSPQDVANTIRASPGSLHAFMTGRRSTLLSAMRNFLSPENQHLMNLVVAAPLYYHHRRFDSISFDGSISKPHDFNRAFDAYIHNRDLRPLTADNFDGYIKLYAVLGKAITAYNLFILARSQDRVPGLSTPEATRSRYQFTDCDLRTPDEEETSRIWRGSLLYELYCIVQGMRQMMDTASSQSDDDTLLLVEISQTFHEFPTHVQEEFMCIQHYVREQYDLAFNELVESFEVAVGGIGQRAVENLPPPTHGRKPIADLEWEDLQQPVQYLFEPPFYSSNPWATKMAALGIGLLQKFLSWDASTRLDFTRIAYPFLSNPEQCPIHNMFTRDTPGITFGDLKAKNFGWSQEYLDDWGWGPRVDDVSQLRLRAVGWIFWHKSNRLSFMNLVQDEVEGSYGYKGSIYPHIRLQGRRHLLEKLVEKHEWDPIVQRFGSSFSESQLDNIKGLFKSIDNLSPSSIADVVSALRCQVDGDAPIEAQESGD